MRPVRHDATSRGRDEGEAHAGLQVGLVETWKELARVGWNEQGVEVVAVVGRIVSADDARAARRDVGHEAEFEDVLAGLEQPCGNDEVAVPCGVLGERVAVGQRFGEPAAAEVDDRVARTGAAKPDRHSTHRAVERGDVERQIVADVVDRRGAMAGEGLGDAGREQRRGAGRRNLGRRRGRSQGDREKQSERRSSAHAPPTYGSGPVRADSRVPAAVIARAGARCTLGLTQGHP